MKPRSPRAPSFAATGVLALLLVTGMARPGAAEALPDKIAVLTGFGQSSPLDPQLVPVMAQLQWRAPEAINSVLGKAQLRLNWLSEAWAAGIMASPSAFEVGVNPLGVELAWDGGQRVVPFVQVAIGLLLTNLQGYPTGGAFQFDETGGVGVDFFLNRTTAISLMYRYRHMSNAGIYEANRGLDTHYGLIGIAIHLDRH